MIRNGALCLMLLLWPVPQLPASPLRAGVAVIEITPSIGTRLAGLDKGRLAKGVHDSLSAKVLVLKTSEASVALVASDLHRLQSSALVNRIHDELGIAHTLNKPAILITQATKPENVPFDIRHLRYIQYDNTVAGGAKLRDDLKTNITRLLSDLYEGWGKQP